MCRQGEAPLHRSSRLGWADCVEELLELKADASLRNHHRLTALDIAGQYEGKTNLKAITQPIGPKVMSRAFSLTDCGVLQARGAVRKKILSLAPTQRTLVLYHDDCLGHTTVCFHHVFITFSAHFSHVLITFCAAGVPPGGPRASDCNHGQATERSSL